MSKDYLYDLFINEAKSALGRHSGSGSVDPDDTTVITFTTDETLELDEDRVLKVNVADEVSADDPLPVSSAAVHEHLNNTVEF